VRQVTQDAVELCVIKPATLKAPIESNLDMDMSELKKDFLEFVGYLKKMAIIHDEHYYVVEQKKTGDTGIWYTCKSSDAVSCSSGHNSGGSSHVGASNKASNRDRTSPDVEGRRTRRALESSRPESRRLPSTRRGVRARSTTCLTVLTLKNPKL
jgi:hypothetical protein